MTRFILFRLLFAFIALIGIVIIVFFLVRASGDPMSLLSNPNLTEEQYEHIKERLGLDKSWGEQLVIYLGDLAHGDLGESHLRPRKRSHECPDRILVRCDGMCLFDDRERAH